VCEFDTKIPWYKSSKERFSVASDLWEVFLWLQTVKRFKEKQMLSVLENVRVRGLQWYIQKALQKTGSQFCESSLSNV
jgi:hypothetical protein